MPPSESLDAEPKRPTSIKQMQALQERVFDRDQIARGLALKLRPTDVVITPYAKSGTTWTQQIVHTLRTRGDIDFDDISRVIPWIEMSPRLGLDLDAEQRANPRAFKSHLPWDSVPKGGRYINVVRNPADALVSHFKFMEGWFFERGALEIDEYARETFLKTRNYFVHLRSWWPRRNDPDVLFLCYEQMLQDGANTIRRIAEFIDVPLDDALLQLTLSSSSIEFMLEHKDRFDDAMLRALLEHEGQLPLGSDSSKVRSGKSGSGAVLSDALKQQLADAWAEEAAEATGCETYADLLKKMDPHIT